jgi:hypothetical protein
MRFHQPCYLSISAISVPSKDTGRLRSIAISSAVLRLWSFHKSVTIMIPLSKLSEFNHSLGKTHPAFRPPSIWPGHSTSPSPASKSVRQTLCATESSALPSPITTPSKATSSRSVPDFNSSSIWCSGQSAQWYYLWLLGTAELPASMLRECVARVGELRLGLTIHSVLGSIDLRFLLHRRKSDAALTFTFEPQHDRPEPKRIASR